MSLSIGHTLVESTLFPVYLKNWSPLTLQCYDAKRLVKCIALRIKRVLPGIVHPDQTGFLRRYIGDNIRQLLEIIEQHKTSKKPGLIFIADFEKFFDKVRLDFIYKCMDFYNFGDSLIKWVKKKCIATPAVK